MNFICFTKCHTLFAPVHKDHFHHFLYIGMLKPHMQKPYKYILKALTPQYCRRVNCITQNISYNCIHLPSQRKVICKPISTPLNILTKQKHNLHPLRKVHCYRIIITIITPTTAANATSDPPTTPPMAASEIK